jgi:membrane associated rhomboid family serine protease
LLIALNLVCYIVQTDRGQGFTNALAVTPYELVHGRDLTGPPEEILVRDPFGRLVVIQIPIQDRDQFLNPEFEHQENQLPIWTTVITAMFLHGSPLHLLGNMLFLWIFGDNVEDRFGKLRYLLLYLSSGVVGFLAQTLASPDSMIPVLGASGAVAGVMGAYLLLFPLNPIRVLIFYFPADLPAYIVIGLWIVSQFVLGLTEMDRLGKTGGVAYLAHIGGVAIGMLLTYLFTMNGAHRQTNIGFESEDQVGF